MAEGEKVVRRLLRSKMSLVSLLLTDEWFERLFPQGAGQPPCDIFVAGKGLLETIVGFRMHQGIMAVARVAPEPSLESLVVSSTQPRLFVALDGLVFAENVGVIVRNCAAFGVQGILAGSTSASPYLRRAVRNSMGTVFQLPIIHTSALPEALSSLQTKHHMDVIIADAHANDDLYNLNCRGDLCVVFGNEDAGVSPSIRPAANAIVRIPMREGVDSLNVASASAVVLSEISRQRAGNLL